jgi:hypothetical protein
MPDTEHEKIYEGIRSYLKTVGMTSVVLYGPHGIITYGSAEDVLKTYVKNDKIFVEEVLPVIMKHINPIALLEIIHGLDNK